MFSPRCSKSMINMGCFNHCSGHKYCLRSSCNSEDVAGRMKIPLGYRCGHFIRDTDSRTNLPAPPLPQALGQALRTSHTILPSRGFQLGHSRERGTGKRSSIHKKGTLKGRSAGREGSPGRESERNKVKEAGNKN